MIFAQKIVAMLVILAAAGREAAAQEGGRPAASAPSIAPTSSAPSTSPSLKQGDVFSLGGRRCVLTRLDTLPYVESDYTKRFQFDTYDNPKLKALREKYRLDDVVASGKDEFDRQVLLLDWVNHRFKKFGRPTSDARGALAILEANDAGHTFFCSHYAAVFVSAAASMGWVDRSLALRRPDSMGQGSTEHSSTEIWSNQYRKWVMFDPLFAMYVEKDGVPLNAFELRQEWFYRDGRDLMFVLDKDRKRYRKADLPVFRSRHAGFGDLSLDPSALNVYAFIGYVPNTNLMDAGPDYARMFITQDRLCEGTRWHKRVVPADPATDPYFPIGQAAMEIRGLDSNSRSLGIRFLSPNFPNFHVALKTLTPNFKTYMARIDGGEWKPVSDTFAWETQEIRGPEIRGLSPGSNLPGLSPNFPKGLTRNFHRLEVKTVNQFGVSGPVSTAEVEVVAGK
ncbi:hypothetical protein FJY63_05430 [Candidatus Sumerlaeota bacterium]|nr:hypothetical protein [Candidatus Sumerlaeota bacterium]